MRLGHRMRSAVALVSLVYGVQAIDQPTESLTGKSKPHPAIETGTCDARTVDHVTQTPLPSCSPDAWTSAGSTAATETILKDGEDLPTAAMGAVDGSETDEALLADAAGSAFMSFEDWKEEMLQRTGQDPQELRSRRVNNHIDRTSLDDNGNVWGDEEEIALDFGEYAPGRPHGHHESINSDHPGQEHGQDGAIVYDHSKGSLHRSKDAGKTCKERFSYSSFDAGATILKTGSATKNAKAILIENKDSYMLLECGRDNKFVIIELSDDILLDTVVIGNFEFFSSMVRHFRLSVSDRYPVKVDKWRELGTFEARNSRDIQAFLVENPQIWAKYVRLEFLTHYGNEFYCPVSLVRIHGSRMLDSWKETDVNREEDPPEDDDREARQCEDQAALDDALQAVGDSDTGIESNTKNLAVTPSANSVTSMDLFAIFAATCPELPSQLNPLETGESTSSIAQPSPGNAALPQDVTSREREATVPTSSIVEIERSTPDAQSITRTVTGPPSASKSRAASSSSGPSDTSTSSDADGSTRKASYTSQAPKASSSGQPAQKGRGTSTANAAAPSHTVQEGFFNSITKRLGQVESNLTLSMKYIEDQSRHMQEAMQRIELKQTQRISLALDALNKTMLADLNTMRDQYEQLWQSTITALEKQRERTEQDAVALSARLNLLADEVVFQKRMAIAQAVLLLSCLFLVIFSRGVQIPYLAYPQHSGENSNHAPSTPSSLANPRFGLASVDRAFTQQSPSGRLMTPDSTHEREMQEDATYCSSDLNAGEDADDAQYQPTQSRSYRPAQLSSPQAQRLNNFEHTELTASTNSRLPASDQHQARKPLPALPEHPLSP